LRRGRVPRGAAHHPRLRPPPQSLRLRLSREGSAPGGRGDGLRRHLQYDEPCGAQPAGRAEGQREGPRCGRARAGLRHLADAVRTRAGSHRHPEPAVAGADLRDRQPLRRRHARYGRPFRQAEGDERAQELLCPGRLAGAGGAALRLLSILLKALQISDLLLHVLEAVVRLVERHLCAFGRPADVALRTALLRQPRAVGRRPDVTLRAARGRHFRALRWRPDVTLRTLRRQPQAVGRLADVALRALAVLIDAALARPLPPFLQTVLFRVRLRAAARGALARIGMIAGPLARRSFRANATPPWRARFQHDEAATAAGGLRWIHRVGWGQRHALRAIDDATG